MVRLRRPRSNAELYAQVDDIIVRLRAWGDLETAQALVNAMQSRHAGEVLGELKLLLRRIRWRYLLKDCAIFLRAQLCLWALFNVA